MIAILRSLCVAFALLVGASGAVQAQQFQLSGVSFTPSVYLEESALQAVVAPYLDRPIGLDDVTRMTDAVQALYTRAGILTARVLLLPQTVDDGILTLTLVEARIDRLTYSGLDDTNPAFLQRNLSLRVDEQPDYDQLQRDLRIFEIAYDFVPQLEFAPGDAFGTVGVTVTADPPETTRWVVSLDNYGSVNTGELRATLQAVFPNLTGTRDTALVQLQASEGSYSLAGTYLRPMGPAAGGVGYVSASTTQSEVVTQAFSVLGLESESTVLTLGYRFPFRITQAAHWMLDGSLVHEASTSSLDANTLQENTLSELALQISYQNVTASRAMSASLGLKVGTVDTLNTSQSEGDYALLFGTATYARRLGENALLDLSGSFQLAPDANLASPRLFSAGGASTVRGYPTDVRAGDGGFVLRTQVSRATPLQIGETDARWTPFAFVDLGLVVPYRAIAQGVDWDRDALASVGLGTTVGFARNVAAVAYVSVPLLESGGFTATHEPVLSIGLDYTF